MFVIIKDDALDMAEIAKRELEQNILTKIRVYKLQNA